MKIANFILHYPFLHADYDEAGMHVYKKNCKSCHGSGDYAAKQLEESQWEDYFLFNASKLKKVHEQQVSVYTKLKSLSSKKITSLSRFLIGNASDSGSVGGCDGNRCGFTSGNVKINQ